MTRSGHLWLPAGAVSLGLHAALGLVLLLAVAPDPLGKQEPVESRIEIVSYPVERTEAASAEPATEAAAEAQARGSAAGTAAIPVSRASAAPLPLAAAQGATPAAARLAETISPAERQQALAVAGPAAPAAVPVAARPAAIAPDGATAAALAPAPQAATPVEAPAPVQQAALELASVAAPAAAPAATRPAAIAPDGATVAALAPEGQAAAPTPVPIQQQAALDVASVAALAAAPTPTRPAEIAPDGATVAALAPAVQTAMPVDAPAPVQQAALAIAGAVVAAAAPAAEAMAAAQAEAVPLRAGAAEAGRLASAPPTAELLPAAAAGNGQVVQEATPEPERAPVTQTAALALAQLPAAVLTDASPEAPLAATLARMTTELPAERTAPAAPAADALDVTLPAGEAGPVVAPSAEAVEQRPPGELATGVPSLAPPAAMVTAALAWSGGTEAQVDPLSLAAIQSFMQEGDLSASAASAGTVRDAITGLLASVPCARLQTTFVPETGQMELRGHIPDEALRAPVLAALHQQVGGSIPLADNMLILPRPQCGALSSIEAIGLPQSTDQHVNPKVLGPDAHARVYSFTDGEDLVFELTGADYPAYVYIDYFDADGGVIHLQPNETVPLRQVGIAEDLKIGAEGEPGVPWIRMTVSPPYGQEIVVAFVSTQPLYEGLRPLREPAGPYLDLLRTAVAEARLLDPAYKGEWVYFFVSTAAR